MSNRDEQFEAKLRARPLPGLSDGARRRLLADLAPAGVVDAGRGPRVVAPGPLQRLRRPPSLAVAMVVAASLLVAVVAWQIWPSEPQLPIDPGVPVAQGDDPEGNQDDPAAPQPVQLAGRWQITPTGQAEYRVITPTHVRLERGELLVESTNGENRGTNPAAESSLVIETPHGEAVATGTRFYIGTHETPQNEDDAMFTSLTRVLVLSGLVTLTGTLGSVDGTAGDLLAAEPDKPPTKLTVDANGDFGFDLYRQLAAENEGQNLFLSPYSITTALTMALEGARTETAAEMGTMLRLPQQARRVGDDAQSIPWETSLMHTGIADLSRRFNAKDKKYELAVANAMWGEQSYPFRREFVDTIDGFYDSGALRMVNFKGNPNGERQRINRWVEDQTNERIKDLLPDGSIDSLTRLVLANAIYFKGDWKVQFKKERTRPGDFTTADGTKQKTPMMYQRFGKHARYLAISADGTPFSTPKMTGRGQKVYPDGDGFLMVELPYVGDELSMVLIAPQKVNGLAALEKTLSSENLAAWTGRLEERNVNVRMPKFKLETSYQLTGTLPKLGMVRAFDSSRADFSGIGTSRDLYVSDVFHKAFVEVNEEGTEAAAATAVVIGARSARPTPFTPSFNADRPFVFLIRDVKSGATLFLGRVTTPQT